MTLHNRLVCGGPVRGLAIVTFLPVMGGLLLAAACGQGGAEPAPRTYTVRGEVVELPAGPGGDLVVHHEAIDDLVGVDGEVWGMDAMVMPFTVEQGVSLEGIGVSDKVEITLRVDWLGDRPHTIVGLSSLAPETGLVFRRARPGGGPETGGQGP